MDAMKIVCITGKAGSGKDTFAAQLRDALESGGKRVLIAHYADLVKYICKQFCGWNGEKDEYGRYLLQRIGTDIFRKNNPNYWVDFLMDVIEIFQNQWNLWDFVLIPDARFPNEYLVPKKRGYQTTLIRIRRDESTSVLTEDQKKHASECSMDDEDADMEIINDGGVSDLAQKASEVAASLT